MRNMGGLRKFMPITYWTALIGSLALIGFPGFSGFFSKDAIIEVVHYSNLPGAQFAYLLVLSGVFITAFYTFRLIFLTFHGETRMDAKTISHVKESPKVITVPLIMLAIPSIFSGLLIGSIVFSDYFASSIYVSENHTALSELQSHYHGVWSFILHGLQGKRFG